MKKRGAFAGRNVGGEYPPKMDNPFPALSALLAVAKGQAKAMMAEELWNWVSAKKGRKIVIEWGKDEEGEDSVQIRTDEP